ncbi:MAG TPA: HNH endonuclease domain-containing protein [Bacteroidales bacterium]
MKKLGLDLGSSSLGWTLREDNKIEKKGVITFQSGMMKGQSGGYSSPTKDRREARSKRRLIQARKYRKWELLRILLNEFMPLDKTELESWSKYKKGQIQKFPENPNFLKWLKCDFSYIGVKTKYDNPYELRVKAISNKPEDKLHKHEFGRALYHLVQRRGYKDVGETDAETEKQKQRRGESGFQKALDENRTIAEALSNEFLNKGKRARNQYPYREEYEKEFILICQTQGYDTTKNEKEEYKNEFVQKLWKAIIWQRPLKSQKGNIGRCTLEPTKPRCPVSHPVFEIFRAWSFINTIKYYDNEGEKKDLEAKERNLLFEFFLKKDKNFKFEEIKTFLNKQFGSNKNYNYPINNDGKYDTSVSGMPVCSGFIKLIGEEALKAIINIDTYNLSNKDIVNEKIKNAIEKYSRKKTLEKVTENNIKIAIENDGIDNAPKIINAYSLYDLWHILFSFDEKTSKDKKFLEKFAVEKLNVPNEISKKGEEFNPFSRLKNNILTGYSDLSLKAMCRIIPFLKEGYLYNEAVVLAKIPELLGEKWEQEKAKIKNIVKKAHETYHEQKDILAITNNLIDQYKGLEEKFAYKNFTYQLDKSDLNDIEKACQGHFGEKSWDKKDENDKNQILTSVKEHYQVFFHDSKRAYREVPLLTTIFKEKLKENKIEISDNLYHHSNRENKYGEPIIDKKTSIEILPEAKIDSIKNPMFNKSMSILRKLINTLIKETIVDKETEVVVEVASELNDNNKRAAIERYQNERKNNREKYRAFLEEFKEKEKKNLNVEESIPTFELWTEQTFEKAKDEKGKEVTNKKNIDILKEKEALTRYELWLQQKGQCMYTGKMISITQLFSNEIDIAHTIPRSLLPDNTMANMTVAYARYNRDIQKTKTPFYCENYYEDKEGIGTAILPRLDNWVQLRDNYKKLYEERIKPYGAEDETKKNKRIQEKHYYKMHYDYWYDKLERFTAEEVKDSWARRQLVDTQMVSKYAREFLKTYFNKVSVQKGSVTANFRKIYGFQEEDEIKSRNRHTHHAIDAAVLTLIPVNSSHRDKILKEYYEAIENSQEIKNRKPFDGFNSQALIRDIEDSTLIVNYEDDKILKQSYRNVRKRGKLQYLKDTKGNFVLNKDGEKILLKSKGDTVRSILYAQTYLGKIKDVERYDDEQPKREGNDWKYKTGKDEFAFVKRENIDKVKASDKLIEAIVDPFIKKLIREQKDKPEIRDYQNKTIRHVRIKTSVGKEVKERVNYRSRHEYKNKFYSESGSVPYAILLQKTDNRNVERDMIPVASFELAKAHKKHGSFVIDEYLKKYDEENGSEYSKNYPDKKLLKVGQKVIVLKDDEEFEKRNDIDFQIKRLYIITQFSDSIWLKYHLEAQSKDDIKDSISNLKDTLLRKYEIPLDIPEITEDKNILDNKKRKEDYEDRKYRFDKINSSFRFKTLCEKIGIEKVKEIKKELDKFKVIPGTIEVEGQTSLLKMSSKYWNFLYEGEDFEVSMLGQIKWLI